MGRCKGVFIPHEFARSVWRLSDEDAGRLLKACFDYQEGFTEAEVADSIKEIWAEFKACFEEEARRYEAKCNKLRANSLKGGEANRAKWKPNGYPNGLNQESEREREGDEEKRSKREVEEEKAKVKEHKKETLHTKKNETEETKQTELFEREAQEESQKPEAKREDKEGEAEPTPRFQKPSVADIAEYVKAKGYEQWVDPEAFWSYHENRDWKVGHHKMKSWHLAITTWMRNNKTRQQQPRRGNGTSVGERAYNMLHFSYEGHPEMWIEEEKKFAELQKYQ